MYLSGFFITYISFLNTLIVLKVYDLHQTVFSI